MTIEDLDRFLDEGADGRSLMRLLEGLLVDEALRKRLEEESLLHAAAGEDSLLAIDRFLLDDFYNNRTPMPLRVRIMMALCRDEGLRRQLEQIDAMYAAAEDYEEEATGESPPDEIAESAAEFDSGERLTLATLGAADYRWRIEEGCAGFHYDISSQAAAGVLGEESEIGLVDEAVITRGSVRFAIALDPRERRLELQISGCTLSREEFEGAEVLLVGPAGKAVGPSSREYSSSLCLVSFAEVNPLERHELEISPVFIAG